VADRVEAPVLLGTLESSPIGYVLVARCALDDSQQLLKSVAVTPDTPSVDQHVLVIEDSASVRRLIEVCLRVLGVTVSSADDGVSGLAAIREVRPDAVVLDIGLPGLDGWEVLRQLRDDHETSSIKVLVLTAHAQPEMADKAERGGADSFMTKPFRPLDLRVQVEKLLAG
jgi:CheY-like chemotaxis protein